MDSRYYPGVEVDVKKLLVELRNLFDADYEVQTMQVAATSVLQASLARYAISPDSQQR